MYQRPKWTLLINKVLFFWSLKHSYGIIYFKQKTFLRQVFTFWDKPYPRHHFPRNALLLESVLLQGVTGTVTSKPLISLWFKLLRFLFSHFFTVVLLPCLRWHSSSPSWSSWSSWSRSGTSSFQFLRIDPSILAGCPVGTRTTVLGFLRRCATWSRLTKTYTGIQGKYIPFENLYLNSININWLNHMVSQKVNLKELLCTF